MKAIVAFNSEVSPRDLGDGVSRKVLAYHERLMIAEVRFETGAVGGVHSHPHLQSTYVKSGRFRFCIDGRAVEVSEGDTLAFPENVPHGVLCLEAGILVDIFSPMREDFI